ncbi:MAG: helix-turn-helix transcriptional regulator, partial [Mycobacterium sp.]
AANALRMWNVDCAEELGRFALDHGGGLPAAIVLAEAIGWQGRSAEVEEVLGAFDLDGPDELLTAHGCLRASNLFWCGDVEQARLLLAKIRNRVDSEETAGLVTAIEVVFAFFSGDVLTAIESGLALCERDVPPVATAWAAAATCWALALTGRYGDVHQLADTGLRAAALGRSGPLRLVIGWAEVMALTAVGDYSAAEQVWERYATMPAGALGLDAVVKAMLGLVNLARGALPSACAAFQNSLSAMSHGAPFSWLMLVAAWSAQAEGGRGNNEAAAAALRSSEEAYGPQTAVFLPELELARAWERASAGQTTAAQMHSMRAAQIARRSGMWDVELRALHTAVRFGDPSGAARLEALATTLNTALAAAIATHARGLANHDGDLLNAAAGRFADIGAVALAADATAQAAREHARKAHRGKEIESSTRAYGLASQYALRTPAVEAAARPLPISDREREIAKLVAAGLSNRQIADRLFVSVRTTEGHLYRIFAKLGITTRDQLIHLLSLDSPGA